MMPQMTGTTIAVLIVMTAFLFHALHMVTAHSSCSSHFKSS